MKREEEEEEVGMRRSSRGSKLRVDTQILFEAGPHPGCPYFTRVYGIRSTYPWISMSFYFFPFFQGFDCPDIVHVNCT